MMRAITAPPNGSRISPDGRWCFDGVPRHETLFAIGSSSEPGLHARSPADRGACGADAVAGLPERGGQAGRERWLDGAWAWSGALNDFQLDAAVLQGLLDDGVALLAGFQSRFLNG